MIPKRHSEIKLTFKALNEKGYETVPETAEQMIKARTSLEMDGTLDFYCYRLTA